VKNNGFTPSSIRFAKGLISKHAKYKPSTFSKLVMDLSKEKGIDPTQDMQESKKEITPRVRYYSFKIKGFTFFFFFRFLSLQWH